jgi:hypothetical protein
VPALTDGSSRPETIAHMSALVALVATALLVTGGASSASPATGPAARVDHLTALARQHYTGEVKGTRTMRTLRRFGRDKTLLNLLGQPNLGAARAYVKRTYWGTWYHWHVSRMRIKKGSTVVVETGVPFVLAPTQVTLRGSGGRALGTLEVSIQDEIGFVRYMHRNYPVDVVVRGQGAGHIQTSLPAAANAKLPSQGPVAIAGRRYLARSFPETAWNGEPVTAWILTKA